MIPANAIKASENKVDVVIKEALSIEDIINAKLTTQTKDGLLSSDGMFYINTKQKASIEKNIIVKLPTNNYNPNMQLFTGNKMGDNIIWENPKSILQNPNIPNGENLFLKNCASCHGIDKKLTGPALAHVETRFNNRINLIEYIKNTQTFMKWHYYAPQDTTNLKGLALKQREEDVAYARYLYCIWGKSAMNVFEGVLNDKEIESIINYIQQESKKYPNSFDTKAQFNNCKKISYELEVLYKAKYDMESKNASRPMVEVQNMQPTIEIEGTVPKVAIEKFTTEKQENGYVFTIDALGWYNIDELLRKENTVISDLTVIPNLDTLKRKEVFLVIPSQKVFAQGGKINASEYSFLNAKNGELPLPQGVTAYVLVFGESNGILYFALQEFITSPSQQIKVSVKVTTNEAIKKAIANLQLSSFKFGVEKNDIPQKLDSVNTLLKSKTLFH